MLFNTYNSRFDEEHIAALGDKVMARGTRSFTHSHVLRGGMTRQLTSGQMPEAIDEWLPEDKPRSPALTTGLLSHRGLMAVVISRQGIGDLAPPPPQSTQSLFSQPGVERKGDTGMGWYGLEMTNPRRTRV